MRCPYCSTEDTRVVDSRLADHGDTVRRRRECQACNERFTTQEQVVLQLPRVIKADGRRERFEEDKLRRGITRALEKRPLGNEAITALINRLTRRLTRSGEREIPSQQIGHQVMEELKELDEVAYVRFASVYRNFQDLEAFSDEVERLREDLIESSQNKFQLSLFAGTRD